MRQIKVAIVGWGNVGRFCKQVLQQTTDMQLVGVVRRAASIKKQDELLSDTRVVSDIKELGKVDIAIVSVPSRLAPQKVSTLLEKGISTVDSFDIHTQILATKKRLQKKAVTHKAVSIFGAGWDPGTDSCVRALFQIVCPAQKTTTTFGGIKGGRSMGHTAAVKAIKGVKNAVSLTLPNGAGKQKREVYIELMPNADFKQVEHAIKTDDYFKDDPTTVHAVDDIAKYDTLNHGGELEQKTSQIVQDYVVEGINPLMTANVLVSSARAAYRALKRKEYGAYVMIERPLIDYIAGDLSDQMKGY
ncbi:MAG: diaminopimelate dehydrogenase [Alphaproteobacteria bacterium]